MAKKKLTKADVVRAAKISHSTISSIVNRPKSNPSVATLGRLEAAYPDILGNRETSGSVNAHSQDDNEIERVRKLIIEPKAGREHDSWRGVPMYETLVSAGNMAMIRDEQNEPSFFLNFPMFRDCNFGARVAGDSMHPEIRNGDFVICKEVSTVIYGDIYLIITFDGVETVKYIFPDEENAENIKLVPLNKNIPITPLPRATIAKYYKVKAVFKLY